MKLFLLIDDDVDDAGLFREALKKVAPLVSLQYFDGGIGAVQSLMEQLAPLPDIIFLDINMPKVNGWQCLTRFKNEARLKDVPVIIYSTSSQAGEIEKAMKLGANGFITKPDSFDQLKKILTKIVVTPKGQLAQALHDITTGEYTNLTP